MNIERKLFSITLFLVVFFAGFVNNASADPYDLDLMDSTCLANDITTGPLGWYCETPSGYFIITFFGINQAGLEGKIIEVKSLDCNTFSIDVGASSNEPVSTNKPPIVTDDTSSTSDIISSNDESNTEELISIKEGVTIFTNLQVKDPHNFTAVKNFGVAKSSTVDSSVDIECSYIAPPRLPPESSKN